MDLVKDDLKQAQLLTATASSLYTDDSVKSISGNTILIKVFIWYEI